MLLMMWLVIYTIGILLEEEQKEETEPEPEEDGPDASSNKVVTDNTDSKSVFLTHNSWKLWHCLGSFCCTERM